MAQGSWGHFLLECGVCTRAKFVVHGFSCASIMGRENMIALTFLNIWITNLSICPSVAISSVIFCLFVCFFNLTEV
jgi:hypothetical protein